MSHSSGREIIDQALTDLRLNEEPGTVDQRLKRLAGKIGYSARTLRGIYYGDVKLTPKFQNWVTKFVQENKGVQAKSLRAGGANVTLLEKRVSMNPQNTTPDEKIELIKSLLDDYGASPQPVKQRWLLEQIAALVEELIRSSTGAIHMRDQS